MSGRYVVLVGNMDDKYLHNVTSIEIFTKQIESGKKVSI